MHKGALPCGGRGFGPPRSSAPTERNGSPPLPPEQRLAKRKARKEELVKFGFCPIPSECSTAYRVRRSAESPARAPADVTLTEQNGLAPHPVVQEDAKRPGCTTTKAIFSSTVNGAFFFQEKKNGGFKAAGLPRHPRPVGRPPDRPPRSSAPTAATREVLSSGTPYLGHGLRRPNFVPKFGASVKSSAPTDAVWGVPRERHAGVVVPYGSITGSAQQTGCRGQCGAAKAPWKALGLRNS